MSGEAIGNPDSCSLSSLEDTARAPHTGSAAAGLLGELASHGVEEEAPETKNIYKLYYIILYMCVHTAMIKIMLMVNNNYLCQSVIYYPQDA